MNKHREVDARRKSARQPKQREALQNIARICQSDEEVCDFLLYGDCACAHEPIVSDKLMDGGK